jgi:hypothetical protein
MTFYMTFYNTSKLPNNPAYAGTPGQQFQAAMDDAAAGGNHY